MPLVDKRAYVKLSDSVLCCKQGVGDPDVYNYENG